MPLVVAGRASRGRVRALTHSGSPGRVTHLRARAPTSRSPAMEPSTDGARTEPARESQRAGQPASGTGFSTTQASKVPGLLYLPLRYGAPGTSASTRAAPPVIIATNQPGPGYLNACAGGHQQGLSAACPSRPQVPRTEKPAKAGHPLPLSSSTRPGRETLLLVSFSSHITAS